MADTLRREAESPARPLGFWIAWLALAATLIPARLQWSWDWGSFAALLLVCAAVIGPGRPPPHLLRLAWWTALLLTWAVFWKDDLRHARFALTLLVIPQLATLCALVAAGFRRQAWTAAISVGAAIGLGIICAMMAPRSHNGCTGVSAAYARTQYVTLLALYLLGPAMLAPSFAACFHWLPNLTRRLRRRRRSNQ